LFFLISRLFLASLTFLPWCPVQAKVARKLTIVVGSAWLVCTFRREGVQI